MKRIILTALVMLCVILSGRSSYADAWSNGYGAFWGSAIAGHESKDGKSFTGLEVSGYALFVNGSIGYRYFSADSEVNNLTAYVGVGVFNVVQLQAGTAYGSGSVRLRSDIPISTSKKHDVFPLIGSPMQEMHQIVVSPFLEWGTGRFTYGLGIGYSF